MERIKIYHAYNGFLYAPIFLAENQGFFPKNTELIYTGGDDKTIELLSSHADSEDKNWFAICDPFAVNLDISGELTNDDICVVGSLINVIPLWVYNSDPQIAPVKDENTLEKYQDKITNIISYPRGTTGHIIAQRIKRVLHLNDQFHTEKQFGEEFNHNITPTTLVITADVLRLVHYGLGRGNIIFSYPTKSPLDLNPFLFTAVLTLKSTVESNLWTVLSVLGAIRSAIECLSQRRVDDRYIKSLVDIFDTSSTPQQTNIFTELSITNPNEKEELIRNAIYHLFVTEKIYDQYPRPKMDNGRSGDDLWVKSWDNASAAWSRETNKNYPSVEQKDEPIPALLVRPSWRYDLIDYFRRLLYPALDDKEIPAESKKEFIKPTERKILAVGYILLLGSAAAVAFCGFHTFDPDLNEPVGHQHHLNMYIFWSMVILFILEVMCVIWLYRSISKLENYNFPMTISLLTLAAFISSIFLMLQFLK